jgi:uncharacterized repeat protein (TIGR02543 family)
MLVKNKLKTTFLFFLILFSSFFSVSVLASDEREVSELVREHLEEKLEFPHRANAFRVQFRDEGVSKLHIRSLNHAMGNMDAETIHRDLPGWLKGTPFENVRYIYLEEGELLDQMVDYYSNSLVASVDPVYELELVDWTTDNGRALPDDWHGTNHWYFNKIELPELWYKQGCHLGSESCGGSDEIVVAVIDTGLGFSNYTADYYDGYTYVSPNPVYAEYEDIEFGKSSEQEGVNLWVNPNPGDGICGDVHGVDMEIWNYNRNISTKDDTSPNICEQSDFAKEGQPNDDRGHGTYVSGIIASATNNGAGSVGMAHNVSIMTIKANLLFAGVFYSDTLEYSIYYAVNNGADVINMSLGGGGVPPYANALDYAEAQGVVVVAASGNSGVNPVIYPAAYGSVLAVGAVNSNNSRSSYSNYGTALDFVAPVGDSTVMWHQTLTCQGTGGCNEGSDLTAYSMRFGAGTSYASPQVAGAVALIKGVNKDFSASAVKNILIETVVDIGEPGKDDETGYGLLNLNNIYDYFVFNLSFDANDGEVVPLSKEVFYNEPVGTLPTPTRLGYDFVEWNTELNGSGDVYTEDTVYEILDDSTLYAQWELIEYTLTYTPGLNGNIIGNLSQVVSYGSDGTTVEAVPNPGYEFLGWSDSKMNNPRTDTNVTENISVTANFGDSDIIPQGIVLEQEIDPGNLMIYFMDEEEEIIPNPIIQYITVQSSSSSQISSSVLANMSRKLRIDNATDYDEISLSLAPVLDRGDFADDARWFSLDHDYPIYSVNEDEGSLEVNPAGASVFTGCSGASISLGSTQRFLFIEEEHENNVVSIDILNVTNGNPCRFEIEGVNFNQIIPALQPPGSYGLAMVLTVMAGGEPEW